jgi:hypothetical protein
MFDEGQKKIGSKKDDKWIGGLGMIGFREVKIVKTDCRWNQGQQNRKCKKAQTWQRKWWKWKARDENAKN